MSEIALSHFGGRGLQVTADVDVGRRPPSTRRRRDRSPQLLDPLVNLLKELAALRLFPSEAQSSVAAAISAWSARISAARPRLGG